MEVVYFVAASVDGFIATPDGGVGWLAPFEGCGDDHGYGEFLATVDGLVMGSRTYEQALGFGPWAWGGKRCWVLSRRGLRPATADVTVTAGPVEEVAAEMAGAGVRRAWLVGGTAAESMRSRGLITEYHVSIVPVVLGGGIPLFASPGPGAALRLVGAKTYRSGIVQVRYAVG